MAGVGAGIDSFYEYLLKVFCFHYCHLATYYYLIVNLISYSPTSCMEREKTWKCLMSFIRASRNTSGKGVAATTTDLIIRMSLFTAYCHLICVCQI